MEEQQIYSIEMIQMDDGLPDGLDSLKAAHTNFHDTVFKNVDELYELK